MKKAYAPSSGGAAPHPTHTHTRTKGRGEQECTPPLSHAPSSTSPSTPRAAADAARMSVRSPLSDACTSGVGETLRNLRAHRRDEWSCGGGEEGGSSTVVDVVAAASAHRQQDEMEEGQTRQAGEWEGGGRHTRTRTRRQETKSFSQWEVGSGKGGVATEKIAAAAAGSALQAPEFACACMC